MALPPAGPPPDAASLHEAALTYLARYAATEAMLRRVLERRVDRWARTASGGVDAELLAEQTASAKSAARTVVVRLAAAGAVNDAKFAEGRARSLTRSGRSQRAVLADLSARGVNKTMAQSVLTEDPDSELAAALVLARKRRIGPFRQGHPPDLAGRHRELGVMARAGFAQDVARRALSMDTDQAEALVMAFRR